MGSKLVELTLDFAAERTAERPRSESERGRHADGTRLGVEAAANPPPGDADRIALPLGRHAVLLAESARDGVGRAPSALQAKVMGTREVDVSHRTAEERGQDYAAPPTRFAGGRGGERGKARVMSGVAWDLWRRDPPRPPMIEPFLGCSPRLGGDVFVAPSAAVVGDVSLGDGASVWYGASLRGDVHWIEVGPGSNVQDNATVHVSRGTHPCQIGAEVTIGHNAVVHGCVIEDGVLVGMGAVVLDGARIGAGSLVGAGALVAGGTVVPPRSLALGVPARVVRSLSDDEVASNWANARHYVRMSRIYLGLDAPLDNPFYSDRRGGVGE